MPTGYLTRPLQVYLTAEQAPSQAMLARAMIAEMVLDGEPIWVTDESGTVVLTLPFRFVLD